MLDLVNLCRTQVIVSMGGVHGLNRLAARAMAEDSGLALDREDWELFDVAEHLWLESVNPEKENTGAGVGSLFSEEA